MSMKETEECWEASTHHKGTVSQPDVNFGWRAGGLSTEKIYKEETVSRTAGTFVDKVEG